MTRFSIAVLAFAFATPAWAQDAALLDAGKRVFLKCRSCHSLEKDAGNMTGPNLWGVFGRKAGTEPDFQYSEAVKKSGIVWDEAKIDEWLSSPKSFLPGNKMAFIGLPKEEDRKAVLAYLKKKSVEE